MEVPEKYRKLYARAMGGRSFKSAIRAYCLMCVGWNPAEVRACSALTCPLHLHRLSAEQARAQSSEPAENAGSGTKRGLGAAGRL